MASRFVGAPEPTGYAAQRVLMGAARTKASKGLFETILSGAGCHDAGSGCGVDYVSTGQVSSGDFPKLKDWPSLAEKEWVPWKREVMSRANVMPALFRLLGPNPPDAPTMEAMLREYDVDAVCVVFLEGNYYVFPAERADGFASSDERYGKCAEGQQLHADARECGRSGGAVRSGNVRPNRSVPQLVPRQRGPNLEDWVIHR